ncbi:hypothetical protein EVAR_59917_1 [Eumeta japonica]|uniref:Uncharacterized protein n=1 Tax=Eumeta variegata TaxID=151549 RepID=A0A4C1YT12_EUMVA|nr:hypothetical protein EVAR_59917_1 [Eumeta japonica]
MMWSTWLQHENRPARPVRPHGTREVTLSDAAFHPLPRGETFDQLHAPRRSLSVISGGVTRRDVTARLFGSRRARR